MSNEEKHCLLSYVGVNIKRSQGRGHCKWSRKGGPRGSSSELLAASSGQTLCRVSAQHHWPGWAGGPRCCPRSRLLATSWLQATRVRPQQESREVAKGPTASEVMEGEANTSMTCTPERGVGCEYRVRARGRVHVIFGGEGPGDKERP